MVLRSLKRIQRRLLTQRRVPKTDVTFSASTLIDNVLKLVQVFSIIFAGLWGLKEFYAFQDRTNALTLKQQELSVRQSELNLQQADVLKEQQSLTLENTRLTIEGQRLSNRLSETRLSQGSDPRFSILLSHEVVDYQKYDDGTHLYYVTVGVSVKNTSDQQLEVTACTFSIYLGTRLDEDLKTGEIAYFNGPPSMFEKPRPGPVKWKKVSAIARNWNSAGESWLMRSGFFKKDDILSGGCSGSAPAGDSLSYREAFVVRALPTEVFDYSTDLLFANFGFTRWRNGGGLLGYESNQNPKP
jgi:regulator of replication initiation timing